MRVVELIRKKRQGLPLTKLELRTLIDDYVLDKVPDYQMSAFAMAVCTQGMINEETTELTLAMAESGQTLDWSDLPGIKVDKHSTGGVGDTTTLVLGPLVAALGVPVAKMSGRGLGHTGGTIDKLESIPGFRTDLDAAQFRRQVADIGIAVAAQTADLAPADKRLYALRDVTGTVESIPLIASSIMSKKLASGADRIVLDVKVGDGAFMKDVNEAKKLAETMVAIGHLANRGVTALLTRMDEPLGRAVGNALEVREAIQTLRGQGPEDLTELCLALGAEMLVQGERAKDQDEASYLLQQAIESGAALDKWKAFVRAQGGDARVADDLSLLPKAPIIDTYCAQVDGIITAMEAEAIGLIAMKLGAGRARYDDVIDGAVGLVLQRKVGQSVVRGEPIVEIHASTRAALEDARAALEECIHVGEGQPFRRGLILDIIRDKPKPAASNPSEADCSLPERTSASKGSSGAAALGSDLLCNAKSAMALAYVPYSHFAVGAALRLSDGSIITGANVENASYGLTNCAERTAIFRAIAEGKLAGDVQISEVAVVADSQDPVAPCGACRQVLAEFCEATAKVTLGNLAGEHLETTVGDLLPYAFSSKQLSNTP